MINRALQTLDRQPSNRLRDVEKSVRDFKAKQFIGADSLVTGRSSESVITQTIAAGVTAAYELNFYAGIKADYQSEVMIAFFINNDANSAYAWPYGTSINTSDLIVTPPYVDLAYSDPFVIGNKTYFTTVKNNTGSPITLYTHFCLLFNKQILAVA